MVKRRGQLKKWGRVVRDVQTRTFRRRHSWCSLVPQYCRAGIAEEAKLKLFFSYIRWISIRPRAKLDGRRTFLSKIETFTKTPFILSRDHFTEKKLFKLYKKLFSDFLSYIFSVSENTKIIHLIMMIWLLSFIVSSYKLASGPPKDPGGSKKILSKSRIWFIEFSP